jgi:hypothetical protein
VFLLEIDFSFLQKEKKKEERKRKRKRKIKRKEKERKEGIKRFETKKLHAIIVTWSYHSSMTKFF